MAENIVSSFYDKTAQEFVKQAGNWASVADTVPSPEKEKYLAKSQEYFQKAIDAYENAKNAAKISKR